MLLGVGYGAGAQDVKGGPQRGPGWRFWAVPRKAQNTTRPLTSWGAAVGYGRGSGTGAACDRPLDYQAQPGGGTAAVRRWGPSGPPARKGRVIPSGRKPGHLLAYNRADPYW